MRKFKQIPVVDIFAGPGGLGEGFGALRSDDQVRFRVALSVEKDPIAHQTLFLRSFYRQFEDGAPGEYYAYLRELDPDGREKRRAELKMKYPQQWRKAELETLRAELGKYPTDDLDDKIEKAIGRTKDWVLIGGPPCQAYSLVGRSRMSRNQKEFSKDPRHFLYKEYLGIIAAHLPPIFVMENVKGLLSSTMNGDYIIDRILSDLRNPRKAMPKRRNRRSAPSAEYDIYPIAKYDLSPQLFEDLNAKDYLIRCEKHGVPQARHRVILLGVRRDFLKDGSVPGNLTISKKSTTMWEAIGDLPKLRSRLSKEKDNGELWRETVSNTNQREVMDDEGVPATVKSRIRELARQVSGALASGQEFLPIEANPTFERDWYFDPLLLGVCNHSTRGHIPQDLCRYFYASCYAQATATSPKLADFPHSLWPNHKNARPNRKGGLIFEDRFRVQVSHRPSTTITSHISKDGHYFIHPDPLQCRSLTVREAARLQTFPDNYFFEGPRTAQYQQVGNAVPPLIARQIASIVAALFE
jgi:DNA (cytosine-5)-methyltransferase 1